MGVIEDLLGVNAELRVFDLEHDRYQGAPIHPHHWPGFVYTLHRHHEPTSKGPRTGASGTVTMAEHSGTHIDALCHQAVGMKMYGGIDVDETTQGPHGFSRLGVETIEPILRRGVLLDVAGVLGSEPLPAGYVITPADLEATVAAHALALRSGDCVLVRTGWAQMFDDPDAYLTAAGVGAAGGRWLAARQPFLCGADNMALDALDDVDEELGELPCHTVLLVESGIYILENLDLEELAATGRHEFLLVCLPLKLRGVTGSPVRPVALAAAD